MIESNVSISFFLVKFRTNAEGKSLIKMNVYSKPIKRRYSTNLFVKPEDWVKLNGTNLRDVELKELKVKLNAIELRAKKIADKISPFSFIVFEEQFFGKTKEADNNKLLKHWFDKYINKLNANGQVGTASSYSTTINSLLIFKKNLLLHDITPGFLSDYENYMLNNKKSNSTIGIYLRQLRAILNQAINEGAMSLEAYPFRKYQIPSGRNVKKALPDGDLKNLLNYKPKAPDQQKALDFWIFSYLCNGMNFTDIIHLKPENINGDFLSYIREKTKRTKKKDLKPIQVALTPKAKKIIAKLKNNDPSNPFLFPILEDNLPPKTIKNRSHRFIKWVNERMEIVGGDLKIKQKIGTYAARHSFSTVLKRKGAPTSFIKESLGHSSELVTENYLDSFTDDVKMDYAKLLTQL